MKTVNIILSTVILLFSLCVNAQDVQSDGEFIYLKKTYTLHDDGSWDYHYSHKLKLNTHFAFHRLYGETFIVYNPEFQKLKVNKSLTTMADGTKVESPSNAYNEVLPRVAKDAPAYNHLKEMVVTHTGLEVGAVIELDYEIHNKKDFTPALMDLVEFGMDSPVQKMVVEVVIPKSKDLNFTFKNMRLGPEITERDNQKVYTWKAKNLKALAHERLSGNRIDHNPTLIFSTVDMFKVFNRFVNQKAFHLKSCDCFKSIIENIKSENTNELDQVRAIQELVVNTVNSYQVPLKYTGWKIRTPQQVWSSNGGNTLEKTTLLASIYKQAGFSTSVVAFFPDHTFNKEYGVLDLITDFVVRVDTKENGTLYLSPNHMGSRDESFNLGAGTLLYLDYDVESLQTKSVNLPLMQTINSVNMKIDENGKIEGKASIKKKGNHISYLSIKQDKKNLYIEWPGFSKDQISDVNLKKLEKDQLSLSLRFSKDAAWKDFDGYKVITLPAVSSALDRLHIGTMVRDRTSAVHLKKHFIESFEYKIEIPKGYTLIGKQDQVELKFEDGSVAVSRSFDGKNILIKRSIDLKNYVIKPSEMKRLIEMIELWENQMYRTIYLKKKEHN